VEGETGSYSDTCVTCDVDGIEEVSIKVEDARDIKEEVSIKVEEAIDIKNEIPEATTFSSVMTEHEVGFIVCVRWWQLMLLGHLFILTASRLWVCFLFLFKLQYLYNFDIMQQILTHLELHVL
jgi:hypothetical protein